MRQYSTLFPFSCVSCISWLTPSGPRFALLIHESPRGLHYDFFLEKGDVLKTWALTQLPAPGLEIPCDALADHRPIYLDYEGPISEGRGTVTRWDQGTYSSKSGATTRLSWRSPEPNSSDGSHCGDRRSNGSSTGSRGRASLCGRIKPDEPGEARAEAISRKGAKFYSESTSQVVEQDLHFAISVVPATTNAPSSSRIVSMWMIRFRLPWADAILIKATGSLSA